MTTKGQTPSIFCFTDYRAYLVTHAQDMRRLNSRWSFGGWAKRLGLKDTSSISKIIKGDREPGAKITGQLIRYFKFTGKEASYFRDLIRLRKIQEDPRLSVLLLEKMGKDHPDGSVKLLDDRAFQIISHWYSFAIREMVRMDQFLEDPDWISKKLQLKVSPKDIREMLELLLKLDLIRRNEFGELEISAGRLQTTNDLTSEAIKRYHESMLDNAKTLLRQLPVEEREFTASVLTMNHEQLPAAKELIREFKDRFCKLMEQNKGDGVYSIQIQFVPLTKMTKKGETKNENQ